MRIQRSGLKKGKAAEEREAERERKLTGGGLRDTKPLITPYRHRRNSSRLGCNWIQMRELYHFLTKWLHDGGRHYCPDF